MSPPSSAAAIVVQSFVAAPPASVWAALRSRTDLLFDGLPAKGWPDGGEAQEPVHFSAPWPFTAALGRGTDVSVTLHELGGGVRVDLRHAGWGEGPKWDDAIQGHFAGWLQGLAAIGLVCETGADPRGTAIGERYFVSGEIPAGAAAVFRSLTDDHVLGHWSEGVFDGATIVESIENRFLRWKHHSEVTAILRPTPRGVHLAIAEYGVRGRDASAKWPAMFERLARFLG